MNINTLTEIARSALERDYAAIGQCLDLSDVELFEIQNELDGFSVSNKPLKLTTVLDDDCQDEQLFVDVVIGSPNNVIALHPHGYDDMHGAEPVALDWFDGKCSVVIWNDEQEDPYQTICLKKTKEWDVSVCRTGYAHKIIRVKASSEKEAVELALEQAGNHEYSESLSEYDAPDGAFEIKE